MTFLGQAQTLYGFDLDIVTALDESLELSLFGGSMSARNLRAILGGDFVLANAKHPFRAPSTTIIAVCRHRSVYRHSEWV